VSSGNDVTSAIRTYRIARYSVPKPSRSEFGAAALKMEDFLKSLDGFVRTWSLEREVGPDALDVITIAEWSSVAAMRNAAIKINLMHREKGVDPKQNLIRLGITMEQWEYKTLAV
jgi:hypothetical protein